MSWVTRKCSGCGSHHSCQLRSCPWARHCVPSGLGLSRQAWWHPLLSLCGFVCCQQLLPQGAVPLQHPQTAMSRMTLNKGPQGLGPCPLPVLRGCLMACRNGFCCMALAAPDAMLGKVLTGTLSGQWGQAGKHQIESGWSYPALCWLCCAWGTALPRMGWLWQRTADLGCSDPSCMYC